MPLPCRGERNSLQLFYNPAQQTDNHEADNGNAPRHAKKNRTARKRPRRSIDKRPSRPTWHGSLKHYGVKYRFILTETTGEDPVKVLDRPGKALSLKTATSIGMSVTIHSRECIHAPVKGEAGFKPDSRILFRPPRTRRLNSPRKLVLLKIILAQNSINESGDADVYGSTPPAKVANTRLAPVWGKYHRLPMGTESTSELEALVQMLSA
ncbi:hypothetical protein MTO96_024941 [Rhipicephalus appendiculatus]